VSELDERGAADCDHAEEREHEDVAEAVIAERPGAARVCDARGDRSQTDRDDRPACARDEVEAEQARDRERRDHRALHRSRADEASGDGARRTDAVWTVGA